jgi:DHA1 family bicyclomycin/chloramphenicol resistance-like MFS transporter
MTGVKRNILILILGLLSAIGPFSIDMYLPGFPVMATRLSTTIDMISYSLSAFFIGICVGQLVCGPLLDRFGRKRPLYIGLTIYILSSIGCALSHAIETLIVFRFFQALGGCVGMVAPRAIIRDIFPLKESAKIFSLMILILGVSPIIAPTVGSYVIEEFGWHYVFIMLAVITFVIFLSVVFLLKESRQPDPYFSLHPRSILQSFVGVLRERQFYMYALTGAIASAGLFAYLSGSPFVMLELFGVSQRHYGFIFAFIASGLIGSSQLNNLLLKRYNSVQIVKSTLIIQTILGVLLFLGSAFHVIGLYGTVGLIFLFLSCQGFSFPNSSALSMAPFTREAGSASALMGALQMGFGAISTALVGFLNPSSALPMTGTMAGCALVALVLLLIAERKAAVMTKQDINEENYNFIENI